MNPRKQKDGNPVNRLRQLCASMDEETLLAVDAAAQRQGVSRSEWVRERITWALMDEGIEA